MHIRLSNKSQTIADRCKTFLFPSGHVFYTRRTAWIAIGIIVAVILPIIMCVVCAVFCYRKKQMKEDPDWKMSLPRSRSGSRATLRNLGTDTDGDSTLKKSRSYDKVYRTNEPLDGKPNIDFPEKKWDLDDEDFMSSDGSEFPATKAASDIEYINRNDPQRQTGRRGNAQPNNDLASPIEDDEGDEDGDDDRFPPPPGTWGATGGPKNLGSPTYSPTFSGIDRNSSNLSAQPPFNLRQPNAIRVLPSTSTNSKFFGEGSMSPTSAGSPTPINQNVGLPSPPVQQAATNAKSTEV